MESILFSEIIAKRIIFLTFITLVVTSFFLIPYEDSYYYWDWSRHLSLSYFDGPPFIAYLMRVFTWAFGNTIHAINLLGVVSIALTTWFIFKTADMLFDRQMALNICLLWIFSTSVFHYLFFWVTYDNPLNVCWAATIYFAIRYIQYHHVKDIYWIGICSGLLLLSKYTGVILLFALLLFILLNSRYRMLLQNKHFYCAIFIAFLMNLPAIIWNHQHHWISLFYQYSYQMNKYRYSPWEALSRYFIKVIKHFDILFLLPIYALFKSYKTIIKNDSLLLLYAIFTIFIVFFMLFSFQNSISKHLLTPLGISSAILSGYYLVKFRLRKLFLFVMFFYILLAIYYVIVNCYFQKYFDENYYSYSLIQSVGLKYTLANIPIVTSDWGVASKLSFWLPGQPAIHTLACGRENQYVYWKRNSKELNAFYFDFTDRSDCIKKYFTDCQPLTTLVHRGSAVGFVKMPTIELFAYFCKT